MPVLSISGSAGKGEADYTTAVEVGETYTYYPLPTSGYEYSHAVFNGVKITSYPVKIVMPSGNMTLSVYYQTIKPPETPAPLPEGETLIETVGASCKIMLKSFPFGRFYYLRHDVQGELTAYDSDISDIRRMIGSFPICNIPVKTESSKINELSQKLDNGLKDLQKSISSTAGLVNTNIENTRKGLEAMINGISSGLSNRIASTENELKSVKKSITDMGGILAGLDAMIDMRLRGMQALIIGWVIDSFITIIEKTLDKEVK